MLVPYGGLDDAPKEWKPTHEVYCRNKKEWEQQPVPQQYQGVSCLVDVMVEMVVDADSVNRTCSKKETSLSNIFSAICVAMPSMHQLWLFLLRPMFVSFTCTRPEVGRSFKTPNKPDMTLQRERTLCISCVRWYRYMLQPDFGHTVNTVKENLRYESSPQG